MTHSKESWDADVLEKQGEVEWGQQRFKWRECRTSSEPTSDFSHHGVVVAPDGDGFVAASPDGRALVHFTVARASRSPNIDVTECHGMSVDAYDSRYSIWIADNGQKYGHKSQGAELKTNRPGQVLRTDLNGTILQRIDEHQLAPDARGWRPTGVTSETQEQGGRVWVADGYGHSLVHCFSRDGQLLWSTDGAQSGIKFKCPHAIILDTRESTSTLLVADRGNKRIAVLTTGGEFLRTFGTDILTSPSGFAIQGERLWITELLGSVVVFNKNHELESQYGTPDDTEIGWPNSLSRDLAVRPAMKTGRFRSPHGIAVNESGVIAISEWVIGGRLVTLTPTATRSAAKISLQN